MHYISNSICYNNKGYISNKTENIFIEHFFLIPKTKPITAGIIHKPPDQLRFLNILSDGLKAPNILNAEYYILADPHKNFTMSTKKNKNIIKGTKKISSETKKYLEF